MSTLQWVILYLCVAALVTGGAVAFAARSRVSQRSTPDFAIGPALLAGAVWPMLVLGLLQGLLVHVLATALRRHPAPAGERDLRPLAAASIGLRSA